MAAKMMKRSKSIQSRRDQAVEEKKKLLKSVENTGKLKIQPADHFARTLVELRDLSVCFDGKALFAPVTFSVQRREKVALRGRNGCGKTTLLRLIAGEQLPYTGTLQLASGLTISVVPQDTGHLQGLLADYLERCGAEQSLCMTILRNLGFEREQFDIPMEQYSQGQKKKVLIARSLSERAHLYLWDEPLNYIDVFSRIQIEQLLRQQEAAMLFVEHDAAFCENVGARVQEIVRLPQ